MSQDILVTCHPQESRHDDHDDMTSFQFNPDDFTDDILRVNSRTSEVSRVEEHHPQHRSSRVHDSVPSSSTSDEIMRRIGEERLVIPHPDDHPSDHNSDSTSSINHESGVGDLQPLKKKRKTATILMVHPDDLEFSDTSQVCSTTAYTCDYFSSPHVIFTNLSPLILSSLTFAHSFHV